MTLADDLKTLIEPIRAIPGTLGLRPYTVTVTAKLRVGSYSLEGATSSEVTTTIENAGQPPKVRFLSEDQKALGQFPEGTVEIGPITPDHVSGGLSFATITGQEEETGTQVRYTLTGPAFPNGAEYRRTKSRSDRALRYMLTLEPVGS